MGVKFDELLGLFLLIYLLESWETFWVSITSFTPRGVVFFKTAKSGIINKEMRRKTCGSSSLIEVFVTENRGEVRKKNRRLVERIEKVGPTRNTRIWSVIIVTKQDTYISISISEKGITKARRVSLKKEIMKIMMMMIVLLFLIVIILLFSVIMNLLILY